MAAPADSKGGEAAANAARESQESSARRGGAGESHAAWMTWALAAASGLAFVLAFPPFYLWPMVVLAPALLAWAALRAKSGKRLALAVYVTQIAVWLWLDIWIASVTAAGYPAKVLYMSAWAVAFAGIVRTVGRHRGLGRLPMTVVVPITWVGLETLRGSILFDGYAWYLLAHPLAELPVLIQTADIGGAYLVSVLVAVLSGAIVDGLRWRSATGGRWTAIGGGLAAVAVWIGAIGYGAWRMGRTDDLREGPAVLLIQTNLAQSNKIAWTMEEQRRDVGGFLAQTRRAFAESGRAADLIVWPETMLPGFGLDLETLDTQLAYGQEDYPLFAKAVFDLSRDLDTPMLIGAASFDGLRVNEEAGRWEWNEHHNSVYLVEGTIPTQRYDKVALTPFGEVMPYISRWDWLEERLLSIGAPGMTFDLDAASSPNRLAVTMERGDGGGETALVVGTPICFEDAAPWLCRELVFAEGRRKRAELLVNLSNDGWFMWWVPGRIQHAQIARFRAVENRVPVLRAVNTGMTVSIDSCGRVVGRIGDGRYGSGRVEGELLARPMIDDRLPIYRTVGEWAGYLMLILTGILVLARLIVGRTMTQDGTGQEAEA